MSLNRTQAPVTTRATQIHPALPERVLLDNGVPLLRLRSEISDACRIDFVFRAGSYCQSAPLLARFTNMLMMEGAGGKSAFDIASLLEFYGAYVHPFAQKDYAGFSVSLLATQLPEVLPIIAAILMEPAFLDDELSLLSEREKKSFIDDLRKVQTVAVREFNEQVFGAGHPYGVKAELHHFDAIATHQLRTFHQKNYREGHCFILAWNSSRPPEVATEAASFPAPAKGFLEMPDKLQNALRVGCTTITIGHPDYPALKVVNTILGGYFGSRLMTNIREEKGYTYGIYSMNVSYKHAGLFLISTECSADHWKDALAEIYKEMERLGSEEVGADELELVKSYMMGSLQRALDCPFNTMDYLRTLFEAEMDPGQYLQTLVKTIQNTDSKIIRNVASAYLTPSVMSEFVCGRK